MKNDLIVAAEKSERALLSKVICFRVIPSRSLHLTQDCRAKSIVSSHVRAVPPRI
jgi:hypothetical protein